MEKPKRKPYGYWTFERCRDEALKYKTKADFLLNCKSAYNKLNKKGWMKEVCIHMTSTQKPKNYWTFERCRYVAAKSDNRSEFRSLSSSAYSKSHKNGWLDEICAHMTPLCSLDQRKIYVFEFNDNHVYVGLSCNPHKRFLDHLRDNKSQVYKHLQLNKNYDFVVSKEYFQPSVASQKEVALINHYSINGWVVLNKDVGGGLGSSKLKWTFKRCKKVFDRCPNITTVKKISTSCYGSAMRNGWLNNLSKHMKPYRKRNGFWDLDECKRKALMFNTREEFKKYFPQAVQSAYRNNWMDHICLHMRKRSGHTKEFCRQQALKHKTREGLKIASSTVYHTIYRKRWSVELLGHMKKKPNPGSFSATFNQCKSLSEKYVNRNCFRNRDRRAYEFCVKNGWLDEFFPKKKNNPLREKTKNS